MGSGEKNHQDLDSEKLDKMYTFSKNMQVVFLLDITGSMGPQLDLMKRMIASFCAEDRNGIDIHVWTFTEAGSNCYVDASPLDLKGSQLVNYVKGIKLGAPPSTTFCAFSLRMHLLIILLQGPQRPEQNRHGSEIMVIKKLTALHCLPASCLP